MGVNHDLKDRLRDSNPSKQVKFTDADAQAGLVLRKVAPVTGDVRAPVPIVANNDPLIQRAEAGESTGIADRLDKGGSAASGDIAPKDPNDDLYTAIEVTLSAEERDAFLEALISGGRYERKFSLFNGKLRGRLRSRSTAESEAIAAWMNTGLREGQYKSPLEYGIAVRNCMLASQVVELNGTRYPELEQPLFRTYNPKAKEGETPHTDPAWLKQAADWSKSQPEPVIAAVYEELRLFERKYWTMVTHASDQNFWRPVEST